MQRLFVPGFYFLLIYHFGNRQERRKELRRLTSTFYAYERVIVVALIYAGIFTDIILIVTSIDLHYAILLDIL